MQMRDMISQLMGSDPSEENPDKVEYWESEVCRAYLLGCCPHEVLAGTRMDIGACARVHEPALRADFNRAEERGKDHYYDLEALDFLERFFAECERKKEVAKKRLEESQEELGEDVGSRALAEAVLDLNEKIGQQLEAAERLGSQGKVDESLKVMESLEELKRQKAEADAAYRASMPASSYQQQKLRVCEVCLLLLLRTSCADWEDRGRSAPPTSASTTTTAASRTTSAASSTSASSSSARSSPSSAPLPRAGARSGTDPPLARTSGEDPPIDRPRPKENEEACRRGESRDRRRSPGGRDRKRSRSRDRDRDRRRDRDRKRK